MSKARVYFLAVVAGMVLTGWVGSASAVYPSKGKRDPFVPLINAEGQRIYPPGLEEGTATGVSGLVLQGIVSDAQGDGYAIINGKVVREGDKINGMTVGRIRPAAVTLLVEGQEHTLELRAPQPLPEEIKEEATP